MGEGVKVQTLRAHSPRRAGVFLGITATLVGCGGIDMGVYRHRDGPRIAPDAGPPRASTDAGTAIAVDAGRSRLLCDEQATIVDFTSPLSCEGLDGCGVTGVRLVWSDGIQAFGIAASADGATRRVWERTLAASGRVTSTLVLDDVKLAGVVTSWPDAVRVKRVPNVGLVLALRGHDGIYPDGTYGASWFVNYDSSRRQLGASENGLQHERPVMADFVAMPTGPAFIEGNADPEGNLVWGQTEDLGLLHVEQPKDYAIPMFDVLAVDQDAGHQSFWYSTDTGGVTFHLPTPPEPGYQRRGDFVQQFDLGTGKRGWRVPLEVHSPVRLRASAAGDVFVAGLLHGDPRDLDVRKLAPDGNLAWAVAPESPTYPVVSLAVDVDDAGSVVVAWNTSAPGNASGQRIVVLERYGADGTTCSRRLFPGVARDVLARPDGRVTIATDDAIVQISL